MSHADITNRPVKLTYFRTIFLQPLLSLSLGCCYELILTPLELFAQTSAAAFSEYEVKSAVILNFLKFTELPRRGDSDEITVCITSNNSSEFDAFKSIDKQTVGGKTTSVRSVSSLEESADCAVLFVTAGATAPFEGGIRRLSSGGTLTIGESASFITTGGIINFFLEETKVRFEINAKRGAEAGLNFSSKLLSLAKVGDR